MISEIKLFDDFQFPISCTSIKFNTNKTQIIATGNYQPAFKIFMVNQPSEFLERRVDSDILDFCFVGRNTRKLAFLRNDKIIEFYENHNSYYKLSIPDFGRNIERFSEKIFFTTSNALHQIDLNVGMAEKVYESESDMNYFSLSRVHGIISLFSQDGIVFVDSRTKEYIKKIRTSVPILTGEFDDNLGLSYATIDQFKIIDLRSDDTLKDLNLKSVRKIKQYKNHWIIASSKGIHIFKNNSIIDDIDLTGIVSFDIKDNIIFVGFDDGQVKSFFIGLDFIPEWCSHAEKFIKD